VTEKNTGILGILPKGPLRQALGNRQDLSKEYNPHVVIVWTSPTQVAVQEYPYKEDAEEKYNDIAQLHVYKVVLAQRVKVHAEG